MRCYYCGSKSVSYVTKNEGYSMGKGIIGTAVLGSVGAVAGINGKKSNIYHCNECGMDSSKTMDIGTDEKINLAIRHKDEIKLKTYKDIYKNIEWNKSNISDVNVDNSSHYDVDKVELFSKREISRNEIKNYIFEYINEMDCPVSISDLQSKFTFSSQRIDDAIQSLKRDGKIKKVNDGIYVIVKNTEEIALLKEKELKKEKQIQQEKSKKLISIIGDIELENTKWKSEIKEIDKLKKNYIEQQKKCISDKINLNITEIEKENTATSKKIEEEINKLKERKLQLQNELNDLGVLAIKKKKDLNKQIELINIQIENKNQKKNEIKEKYLKRIEELRKNEQDEKNVLIKDVDKIFKIPNEPSEIAKEINEIFNYDPTSNEQYMTRIQRERRIMAQTVYENMLTFDKPVKAYEINNELKLGYSMMQMYSIFKMLVEEKKVFCIPDENDSHNNLYNALPDNYKSITDKNYKLIDKDINSQFAKDRNYVFNEMKKLKNPSTISTINSNNFSEIRIRQILNSLEKENICVKVIRNGELYYAIV